MARPRSLRSRWSLRDRPSPFRLSLFSNKRREVRHMLRVVWCCGPSGSPSRRPHHHLCAFAQHCCSSLRVVEAGLSCSTHAVDSSTRLRLCSAFVGAVAIRALSPIDRLALSRLVHDLLSALLSSHLSSTCSSGICENTPLRSRASWRRSERE